jgi:serine/threonine protein kinase
MVELISAVEGAHSERAVAQWARNMIGAIAHLHAKNVAHRDVKPENFLLETRVYDTPFLHSLTQLIPSLFSIRLMVLVYSYRTLHFV